jgi:hypothetical protein
MAGPAGTAGVLVEISCRYTRHGLLLETVDVCFYVLLFAGILWLFRNDVKIQLLPIFQHPKNIESQKKSFRTISPLQLLALFHRCVHEPGPGLRSRSPAVHNKCVRGA